MKVKQGYPFQQAIILFLLNKRDSAFQLTRLVLRLELNKNIYRDRTLRGLCVVTTMYVCVTVGVRMHVCMYMYVHASF